MPKIKVEFPNQRGQMLAGLLDQPDPSVPFRGYALFAHCFTCGKDIASANRIARTLAQHGIGALRFDFTGLGDSEGDFSQTNFTTNLQDLRAAAAMLAERYASPSLLIGHSLGGATVLTVAPELASVLGVVTIGSPATASHLAHHFSGILDEMKSQGEASITIGHQTFVIRPQLLDDIARYDSTDYIRKLKRPLLVFHAPMDTTVSINEAASIFNAAFHPKSFISLDTADHMLTNRADASYVATMLLAWAKRYLKPEAE